MSEIHHKNWLAAKLQENLELLQEMLKLN